MIDVVAFVSEMEKISACKSRKGAMPIRAHNLAGKESFDGRDKLLSKLSGVKMEAAKKSVQEFAKKHEVLGKALKAGAVIGAWETGKQGVQDYQTGRAYRKQMSRRG